MNLFFNGGVVAEKKILQFFLEKFKDYRPPKTLGPTNWCVGGVVGLLTTPSFQLAKCHCCYTPIFALVKFPQRDH